MSGGVCLCVAWLFAFPTADETLQMWCGSGIVYTNFYAYKKNVETKMNKSYQEIYSSCLKK